MATVKNVGLSPLNMGDVKKYTAMQSPSYKEEFWKKMSDTNDIDYYLYALNEADKKGLKIEDIDFSNLDSIDDQWSAFYTQALADDTTKTDYGTVIEGEEPWGELTEKQYLTKLLDKKREYNIWLKEEAEIAAQKEAMSGWDKFWNGVGAWGTELLHSLEQIPLSLADFVTNWDGGDSVGFIEDWRQDLMNRQRELANYERSYTNLRAVDGDWDPTFMGQLVMGSAQTLGLMIPSMITNFVIPGSGFWVMYSNVFLENVYEARHDPNVNASQIEIILRGALMAGAEAYIEWALGSSMLDDLVLNGKKFSKELVNVTTKEGLKILGKDIIHEACEEALQELSGYMVNMVLSLANPTWEQTMSDDLAKDIGMAALMGGIFAAANIVNSTVIQDIANGRVVRNITRKFTAGDIISDYKVDKKTNKVKEGFHATNFFERIALNANFSTFKNNLDLAKKGKLSSEEKNFLYNQAMALGEIFNRSNPSQIKRSMELLNKLQEYVKQEGVKEETLKKADEAYLSSLLINIKAVQSTAATEYWKSKISNKEAAKLAKDAKITKTEKVIDKKNVEEVTKTIDNNTKDPKKKARKKVVKTLIDEGKTIATTDGEKLEVIGDVVFVPNNYLNDGDPNFIVRNSIEKDLAQEFVVYMKSPKRLVGWIQAKAALIKVYPEMAEYTDQQFARNLLFNPGGAYALVAALPNSEFNLLFLNMLEGLKQVVYKTEVAKTVKTSVISNIENNFRYAARMFCANNYGVNPHDLHNVLTKADQMFIKNERAKIEAEANEWARSNKKVFDKQSLEFQEESIDEFHKKYSDAQKGKKELIVYSGTLERRGYLPDDINSFNSLYKEADKVREGDFLTPPKPLWTTSEEAIRNIYSPGKNIDGDRTIQWTIKIEKGAPDCNFFDGNQSYVFENTPILVEAKNVDENGNIFIEGRIGGEGYYQETKINPENVRTETSDPEILNPHLFRGISKNRPNHSHYFYYYSTDPEVASSYQGKEGRLTEKDVHFKPGELEVIDFDGDYFEWNEDTFFEEPKEGEKGKRVFEVKVYDGEKYDTIRFKLRSNVKDNKPLIKVTKALYEGYGKMIEIQYKRGLKGKLNLLKKPPYKLKITPELITELKPLLDFFNLPYTEEAVLYLRYLYKANQEEEPRTELYVLRYKIDYPDLKGIAFKNIRDGANEKIAEKTNTVYVLYNEETNSSEIREEMNELDSDLEGASFITPEYENESYKYMQSTLLKENIPELEKSNLTIKDVIKNPESYLRPEIIDFIIKNFGDLSRDSVYMGLRSYLIGETDGTKTITVSENGDRYYFADVTPIKKFNSDSITMEVDNNPTGTSLFEKYSGKTVKAGEFWRGEALIGKAKNVEIEFREGGGNFYSDEQNKIYIDTKSFLKTNQDLLFALNHEFQHALQSTNRTARGFTLGAKLPQELVEEVKEMFPEAFKDGMSQDQEVKVANRIIYKYSGEMEANLHSIDEEYYPFIIAIKDDHYVILSPKGSKPYDVPFVRTNKMDEKEDVDTHVKERVNQLKRNPDKDLIETTNLKYFKRKGKKLRLDPDLQTFIIEATNLDQMEEWLSSRIKDGTLRKRKLMKWFKETPNINEYTFKHLREAFWPNSTILTFEDLQKASITLTMEIDEKGNPVLVPFVFNGKRVGEKPKEVVYKYGKDRFSINENSYRVALMEYWTGYADVNKVRRIVGATEILRRTETFTSVEEKAKNSSKDGDIDLVLGVTEDFADAVLNDMPRSKKAQKLREIVVKSIAAKSIAGDYTYEEALKMLNKYTIEYFEDLPDEELDNLYVTEMMKKDGLNVNKEIIKKAITRNRKNAIANMKRLATTIWNNTTVKNRKRLPSDIQNMFTEEGKLKPEVYKGRPISEVSSSEELLKETALKARRGDYASSEIEKAYASVDKARKQIEKLKKKSKTQVKSTTKVVTEYKTDIKTEAKVITVQTTKKETPKKLEKLLGTNFTKKRMSNMQEMSNYEYFVSEKEVFREENQEVLDSITEAEWIEIVEWFEQSEIVGTEGDLGTFKAIRMFILADLVSRIKTHNIVLDNTWLNRANNIMSSNVHSSAVELATWGKVLNSINPYRQLAEQYNVSEETLDNIQDALETDNDEELAKAIDELRLEIAENYVEKNMMEKIMAFRYTAMLSGPVTWLRNLISNYIVKYFNKAAASIGDKLGGKRLSTYQGYKLVGTKVRRDVAEFIKVNLLDTGLLHQLTEGYSKYDPYTAETANKIDKDYIVRTMVNNFAKKFEQDHAYGDGKAAQVFNKFSAFVRKMISDDKFVNEATLRYFGKMLTEDIESGRMDPNKLKEGIFNKEIVSKFAEAQWLAMGDYMKNTNFMTKAISALNESKWARYIMPLIMPFAQSSWNWWVETMRYSPFGLVQSVVQLLKYEKYVGEMDRKRESSRKGQSASVQGAMLDKYMTLRNLGKGAIGTSLWTLGIILGAAGVVGLQKNKDDKYVIKIGPIEINVDNLFGSSTFLAGAALVTAIKDGKWLEMFNVTIDQMARTLFVTDLISSFKFQSIGDYVAELPLNVLYSFIPNFIKMISQNVQIYNVKYDKGILGDLERMASGIIPGLSYAFPKEIDPFTGKPRFHRIPILTQAGGISYNDISEAERAAIAVGVGAGQLTGELTVNGEKYQLDREKVNVYRGEITNQYMTDLLNDQYIYEGKRYSQMDRKERAKAIKSILNKSAEYAKIKMWTEMGNKYYTSKDLYVTLKNLGINNVYQGSGGYIKK